MKKGMCSLFAMLFFLVMATSQTERGNWLVGGNASWDLELEEDGLFTLSLDPNAAIFVADQLAVGVGLGLEYLHMPNSSLTVFRALPMARYYFAKIGNSAFLAEARTGLALSRAMFDSEYDTETAFHISAGAGAAFFVTDCAAIEAIANYHHTGGVFDQSNLGLTIGFQLYLGSNGK